MTPKFLGMSFVSSSFRAFVIVSVFLCLFMCSANAADSVLTDDPRLDQKVNLTIEGLTVSAVLDQLSSTTGVTIAAGLNDKDWSVRDRKVIVQVSDMKLSELMGQLSKVLHFHWSKGLAEGKASYRLWQDKTELAEEESLRAAGDSAQSKEARDIRENALADMVNLGSLGASDKTKLKANDPWRYVLATEPLGRDVADLMTNFADARNAFVQGTEASFAVVDLPAAMQETVRRIAQSYDSLTKGIGASEDHAALLAKFDKLQITINQRPKGVTDASSVVSKSMLGRITIGTGSDSFEIPLFDPSSQVGEALGTAIIALKGGASQDAVAKQLESDMAKAVRAADSASAAGPRRDVSSDPDLREKAKLFAQPSSVTLPVALKALGINAKLNVISDYFAGVVAVYDGGEKTVGDHLEAIRKLYGSNWTKAGNVVTLQDKDWFNKRVWAVPDVWMKYWTDRGQTNNGLLIDDFVQIGSLRDEQIDHTIMSDPGLLKLGAGEASRNRQILRFYAGVTADQQKLMADGKLDASSLTDDQWSLLKSALATKGAAYAAVKKGSQTISYAQSGKDASEISYTFSFNPGGSDAPVTFKLTSGVVFAGFPQKKPNLGPVAR